MAGRPEGLDPAGEVPVHLGTQVVPLPKMSPPSIKSAFSGPDLASMRLRGRSGPASKYMSSEGPRRPSGCSWELRSHTHPGQQKRGSSIPQGPQAGCGGRVAPRAGPGLGGPQGVYSGRVEQGSHCPHPELMARNPAGHPQVSSGHAEAAECCGETAQWGPACPQPPGRPRWSFYPEELPPRPQVVRGSQAVLLLLPHFLGLYYLAGWGFRSPVISWVTAGAQARLR